jgi:hypothetical protein
VMTREVPQLPSNQELEQQPTSSLPFPPTSGWGVGQTLLPSHEASTPRFEDGCRHQADSRGLGYPIETGILGGRHNMRAGTRRDG